MHNEDKVKNNVLKQLYQEPSLNKSHQHKIKAPSVGYLQADLMLTNTLFPSHNSNVRYLLNVIDVHSRYAWSFPLRNKKADTILSHLKVVHRDLTENGYTFHTFTTDEGSEFKGSVSEYLEENNVIQYLVDPIYNRGTTMLVERFNRTISELIVQSFYIDLKWVYRIGKIIDEYRNRKHTMIKETPYNVYINKQKVKNEELLKGDKGLPFKAGDKVLLQINLEKFDKLATNMRWYPVPLKIIGRSEEYNKRYIVMNLITGKLQEYNPISSELKKISDTIADGLIEHYEYFDNLLQKSRRQISELIDETVLEVTGDNQIVRKTRLTAKTLALRETIVNS